MVDLGEVAGWLLLVEVAVGGNLEGNDTDLAVEGVALAGIDPGIGHGGKDLFLYVDFIERIDGLARIEGDVLGLGAFPGGGGGELLFLGGLELEFAEVKVLEDFANILGEALEVGLLVGRGSGFPILGGPRLRDLFQGSPMIVSG